MRVAGDDAASFLQGQFTNDLRVLPRANAIYGLWLTVKGKVLADSFVLPGHAPGEFWIGSYFSSAAVIRERLESHIIADDVTVEDVTAEWAGVTVFGADTDEVLTPLSGRSAFRGRRGDGASVEWMYRLVDGEPAELSQSGPTKMLSAEQMTRLRIEAGIPAIPPDIGGADLPNEAGLETDAISYTKGCYLGQEVMARLKSMGQVRRRLLRVRGADRTYPALPAAVFVGARQVGELRSAVPLEGEGWMGLAMLSLLHLASGTVLSFSANGPATIHLPDAP